MKRRASQQTVRATANILRRFPALLTVSLIFAMGMAVFIGNALILYRNLTVLDEQQSWVQHTRDVLDGLERTISSMSEAETSVRGYVLTGGSASLERYEQARGKLSDELFKVSSLVGDNVGQLARFRRLEGAVQSNLKRLAFLVEETKTKGMDAGREAVRSGIGIGLMREMRLIADDMRSAEQDLLEARSTQAKASRESVSHAFALATFANFGVLLLAYYFVRRNLIAQAREQVRLEEEAWIKEKLAQLGAISRGNLTEEALGAKMLGFFATHLRIPVGTLYTFHDGELRLCASHAGSGAILAHASLKKGEGLAWAAVGERRLIHQKDLPDSYLKVTSTIGSTPVRHLVVIPLLFEDQVKGVLELGALEPFRDKDFLLFDSIENGFGVSIDAAQSRARTQELLEETQIQAEELQAQQEELRAGNEELEMQTVSLKSTQQRLEVEQANLRHMNHELECKAAELSRASGYKSEFLANMSHELRTPLNSLLILATLLYENEENNLTEKQVEFAKTIHRSGSDLLSLINDILDLSKVEAGKLEIEVEDVWLSQLSEDLDRAFRSAAEQKHLAFAVELSADLPSLIRSDRRRIEQILKNFLSNALKFTESGRVRVGFENAGPDAIAIRVSDTGVGIRADKQDLIFEAFQQADGSTSRRFGGTGLGLTISRELAQLLQGRIELTSELGKGSVFSLILPLALSAPSAQEVPPEPEIVHGSNSAPSPHLWTEGDLDNLEPNDRTVVIVEDDLQFGRILLSQAHEAGFKAILTNSGEAGFEVINKYTVHGVVLDLRLPDVSGLSLLERLKTEPKTRHLPTHIISAHDFSQNALKMGAMGYLVKPVTRTQIQDVFARLEDTLAKKIKRVLVVEDDKVQRDAMFELLRSGDIEIDTAGLGSEAIHMVERTVYDCIILDLRLPDISGFELLKTLDAKEGGPRPPVVIYTGKDLSKSEIEQLRKYSESIVLKGAKSPERLLDEVNLFLHRVEAHLPSTSQAILRSLRVQDETLKDRKILLVDDDMRNVFALTNMLEAKGLKVVTCRNGREAVEVVRADAELELVLMDIMMPQMNGYEAMAEIRKDYSHNALPIIALTAKAMKGDQEKCLASGANDYVAKPVAPERLLSLLRVWLPKKNEI